MTDFFTRMQTTKQRGYTEENEPVTNRIITLAEGFIEASSCVGLNIKNLIKSKNLRPSV